MERLKRIRTDAGKTQDNVASFLGVARSTYTKYETGDRLPDLSTIKKLAEYFNTTTDYLLGNTEDPSPPEIKKDAPVKASEDDIMFALFDGDVDEITDAMYAEVKDFARFVKEREKRKQLNGA